MLDAVVVHNEVYNLLLKHYKADPTFRFTLRKSNRDSRLEKGYWFYGNEWYLAVSFWTGMDWKNKTPNIIFTILFETGETYLEINTSDSDKKRAFINEYLATPLRLESFGKRYRKQYSGNYLETLEIFLVTDKVIIDQVIADYAKDFFSKEESNIYFINQLEFEQQKDKTERYIKNFTNEEIIGPLPINKPIKIKQVEIEHYGPIENIKFADIPFSSQWIFFTGENGTGKTSILRAIASSICYKRIENDEIHNNKVFKTTITYYQSNSQPSTFNRINNDIPDINEPIVNGFAAYGPSRLKISLQSQSGSNTSSSNLLSSLFDEGGNLLDLQTQFDVWQRDRINEYSKRMDYIKEILTDILPNLYDIIFDDIVNGDRTTSYIEKDNEGGQFLKVSFAKLASGLKSLVAMIGDILIRFYEQQPKVFDPAEFTGIVLIDEIDIHLHPKLQKQLVQQLTKTFPKIQFIATTHSPIPFLGAPKNSAIFKVNRNSESGVSLKRLDHQLELGDLLPNTILTSPIFGFVDIVPESHSPDNLIRTEDNFNEMKFNDQVKEKIQDFITDRKEQELINLFKSRRR